jgi:hypothetical protein
LKNLRRNFERFCYNNRGKGIPNLMLYIVIGSAIVYLLSLINGGSALYELLRFDKALILRGQVWRLITYVFTYAPGSSPILIMVGLYFFYHLSRSIEMGIGTLKFNLFYFSGMLMMDVFAMIFCPTGDVMIAGGSVPADYFSYAIYGNMALYLHMSLILLFATANPQAQFLIFFLIPVRAWLIGMLDLVLLLISVFNMTFPIPLFPHNLFPLVGVLNYLLYVGKDVINLFPFLKNARLRKAPAKKPQTGTISFERKSAAPSPSKAAYTHRCTVCGRTDVSDPDLEFRYCSRCNGYYCYCQEHISNHTHVQ